MNSEEYENGCTLEGYYFGDGVDSGCDYLKASREIIAHPGILVWTLDLQMSMKN